MSKIENKQAAQTMVVTENGELVYVHSLTIEQTNPLICTYVKNHKGRRTIRTVKVRSVHCINKNAGRDKAGTYGG
jgi:hypothetical protein